MKKTVVFAFFALMLATSAAPIAAESAGRVACSVCGYLTPENEALSAAYEDAVYHFCSPGCRAYFDHDPAAVAAGEDIDAVCGKTVSKDKAVSIEHNGRMTFFCCDACKDKFLGNPAEYEMNYDPVSHAVARQKDMKFASTFEGMPVSFESAENKAAFDANPSAYVHDMCPVTGKVFLRNDAGAKLEHKGKTYYFCCESCMKKFKADPRKYLDRERGAAYETCGDAKPEKTKTGEETKKKS